jgi:hypothetical protein
LATIADRIIADFDYKGWRVRLRSKMAPDAGQWFAHALLVSDDGRQRWIQPLGFRDARTFPSLTAANRAAKELARAWIDRQATASAD